MTSRPEEPTSAEAARNSSDDTIELELTEDQGAALSRAAADAVHPDELDPGPTVPEYMTLAFRPTARTEFVCNVTLAALAVGIAIAFLWPKADRHHPSVPLVASIAPVAAAISAPAPSQPAGPPVRITNAFDATEVFEFPFGTSETEARAAVTELLLNRARERRAAGMALRQVKGARLLARTKIALNATN
jgi:hypothetical protein